MNTADLANERAFAEVKRLCLMGLDSTTLRQRVAERMGRAVPFEGYVAFTMDPTSGLITHAIVEEMGDESGLRLFLEHVYFEDDVLEFNWMARNRLPAGLLSEATGGKLELAPRYRELQAPAGLGYELRGAFSTGALLWGGLCLSREKGRLDFATREVALMRRVAPHLGAGSPRTLAQGSGQLPFSRSYTTTTSTLTTRRGFWSSTGGGRWCSTTRQPNAGWKTWGISERGGERGRDSRRLSGRCSAP